MHKFNPVTNELIEQLKQVCGAANVLTDHEKLDLYKTDEEGNPKYHRLPEVVVLPACTEEVAAIVKLANKYLVPITPRSAGTSLSGGAIPVYHGIVLLMERMNKIIELNVDSLYLTVEAGVRTEDIQKLAQDNNLLYAGDPCSADSCLIGGNIATNAGGNKAVRYGTTRHQVYALEIVTPTGEITNVGARLNKNSTGFALEQLIMGAEGTLGIITKATLKLVPLAPHRMDLLAIFTDLEQSIRLVAEILKAGLNPTSIEFLENAAVQSTSRYTGVVLPHMDKGHYVIVTLESFSEEDLENNICALDEICTEAGAIEVLEADDRVWKLRKNFTEAARVDSLISMTEDAVVPVDQIASTILKLEEIRAKYGVQVRTAAHIGDGNIHFKLLKCDLTDEQWSQALEAMHKEVFEYIYSVGGRISGEHGIGSKKTGIMKHFTDPVEFSIMQTIKQAMDPNNILNPGKIFE